jgi:hypothetical protein
MCVRVQPAVTVAEAADLQMFQVLHQMYGKTIYNRSIMASVLNALHLGM